MFSCIYTTSFLVLQKFDSTLILKSEFSHQNFFLQKKFNNANPANKRKIKKLSERHVAFQLSQFFSKMKSKNPDHPQKLFFSRYNDMTILNHFIDKTTSILKCIPHRLRMKNKKSKNLKKCIEELAIKNENLRKELTYYNNTRAILIKFFDDINKSHQIMKSVLYEIFKNVTIFEKRVLNYWKIHHDDKNVVNKMFF